MPTTYVLIELASDGERPQAAENIDLDLDSSDPRTLRITLPSHPFGVFPMKIKGANAFVKIRITRADGASLETEGHISSGIDVGGYFTISASPATFS